MAYFSNGTEGMIWEEQWCNRCVHNKDPEEDGGCVVLFVHLLHNYDQTDNEALESVLGCLIPTNEDGFAGECKMFIEETKDRT